MSIGILHPGAMGASIGAALVGAGHEVLWASEGRSAATRARADADGLVDVGSLGDLVARSDTIVSVCPPSEALSVARDVAALGFAGVYLDANAVAPETARAIAAIVGEAGADVLDGGIIGPPARHRGLTVLYLSGDPARSDAVAARFDGGPLETLHVGDEPGAASAVKMAFAAWTKGTSALLLAVRALAETEGVVEGLDHAWSKLTPELADRLPVTAKGTAPKAWRFVGEMREIAATFEAAGLPGGFHAAAAEIYGALADLRDRDDIGVDDVMRRLRGS
jgi:3-hydroxyisobutyrate dehydrogenase-like beta-hydroxyacid dehydrogenase